MYVRNFVKRPQYLYHLIFMYLKRQTWINAENDVIGFLFVSKREKFARNANGLKALLK